MTDPNALAQAYENGAIISELAERNDITYYKTRSLLLAAGVTLRKTGPAIPPAPAGMVTQYLKGSTLPEVAAQFGLSFGVARRMLLEEGVTLRPRGRR